MFSGGIEVECWLKLGKYCDCSSQRQAKIGISTLILG